MMSGAALHRRTGRTQYAAGRRVHGESTPTIFKA
jgi:hypothetical protein